MASLRDLFAPLSEPLGPRVREAVLRALRRLRPLPSDVSLGPVTLEGSRVTLTELALTWSAASGGARLEARRVVLGLRPQGWLVRDQPEVCLEAVDATVELRPPAPLAPIRAELRFHPSGRTERWVDGHAFLEGAGLSLSTSVKASATELTLGDLRLAGPRTDLRGRVALGLGGARHVAATLAGRLALGDLPLAPLASLPLDPRELSLQVALDLDGPFGRGAVPDGRLTLDALGAPLRAPGQRRFLPHLRLERAHAEARVEGGRVTVRAELEPNGGGRVDLEAELGAAIRATVRELAPATLQLALDLADAARGQERRAGQPRSRAALRGAPVSGTVTLDAGQLHAALEAATLTLDLDGASFPLDRPRLVLDGAARAPDLRLEASIDGGSLSVARPAGGAPSLRVRRAHATLLTRLAAMDPAMPPLVLAGEPAAPGAIVVPPGLAIDLDARPARDALSADLTIEGEGTRVVVHLDALDALHRASRVVGHVALAHVSALLDLPTRAPGLVLSGEPLALDLALLGSATVRDLASSAGTLTLSSATVGYQGRALTVGPLSVQVHVAPTWLAFDELDARVGRGAVRAAGVVAFGGGAPRARVHLACEDVRLGRDELFPEGPPLDGRAFAHAWLALTGAGLAEARGELRGRIEAPRYAFLTRATAGLARVGLPPVPTEGDSALEAYAVLEGDMLRVRSLRASVPGVRATARGDARASDGQLRADLALVADRAWLSQRALYALPGALLGWVDVPVSLRGSLARPAARAEIAQAVLKSLGRSWREIGQGRTPAARALGPRALPVPDAPLAPEEAARVRTLVRGGLPLDALAALATRFVEGTPAGE